MAALLIAQQGGALLVRQANGTAIGTMLTVSVDSQGERGLLGVTPHPNFASNGFIYIYYTTTQNGTHNRISRFTVSGNTAGSELVLVNLPSLSSATNHNGGALHFGSDGKLYVAVGDNANGANAPDLNSPLGKMLRFNDDGTIPGDNPFCTTQGNVECAIWARGLRNPFTFAVRASDGRIHINDVGAGTWEEINLGAAGANYGWPSTEGPTTASGVTGPLFAFDHDSEADSRAGFFSGCAVIGGAFYPDSGPFPPTYRGDYYFTDLCTPVIGRIDLCQWQCCLRVRQCVGLSGGHAGRQRRRVAGAEAKRHRPLQRTVNEADPAHAGRARPLSGTRFAPQRRVARQTSTPVLRRPRHFAQGGTMGIRKQVCRSFALLGAAVVGLAGCGGDDDSAPPSTTNTAPTAEITSPAAGATFRAGDSLNFAGSATDAEDGALASGQLDVVGRSAPRQHTHPFVPPTTGASGNATVPVRGETSDNIFYRIHLRATDSAGATTEVTRDVLPQKVAGDPGHAARWAAPHARRPAGDRAAQLHRRGRHRARPRCGRSESSTAATTSSAPGARRRQRHAHDQHAGDQHHLHRHLHRHRAGRQRAADGGLTAPANNSTRHGRHADHAHRHAVRQRRQHCQRGVLRRRHGDRCADASAPYLGELDSVFGHGTHTLTARATDDAAARHHECRA